MIPRLLCNYQEYYAIIKVIILFYLSGAFKESKKALSMVKGVNDYF